MATRTTARRLRPTKRAWGLAIAGALSLLLALLFGRQELLGAGVFLIALPACAVAARWLVQPRLELERTVFPRAIGVGDRLRVVSELRNRSIIALEPVSYLDLTPGAGRSAIGGVLPGISGRLRRNEAKRRRRIAYSLGSMRRGIHDIGPLYLDNIDALGLTRRVLEIGEQVEVEVWPRIHPVDELDVPATRSGGEVEAGIAIAGDSDDVLTREYRRGDPMRRVHWKASARSGDLRVRQEEHHAEVSSLVVLDTGHAPGQPEPARPATIFEIMDRRAGDEQAQLDPVFEQAVSIAASLVARLHELGYQTDFYETRALSGGLDDPRIGGARVAAEEPLEPIMRHLMLVQPAPADDDATGAVDDLLDRAARIGRAPTFLVHRVAAGAELERLAGLARTGDPAVCILVTAGEADIDAERLAAQGWDVIGVDALAEDPWSSMRRWLAEEGVA